MPFNYSWTKPSDNNNAVLSLSVTLNHTDLWNQQTDPRGVMWALHHQHSWQ